MSVTVKLFMDGDCQALDLPEDCRFEGEEVWIRKVGDKVILEPITMPPVDTEAELERAGAACRRLAGHPRSGDLIIHEC